MGRLNAGQLNQRITLRTPGPAVGDGRGGWLDGPETSVEVYARVRPIRGAEALALGQTLNSALYEVTIRYRAQASTKQRIVWKGISLNVRALAADEYNEFHVLTCSDGGQ